MRHRFIPNFEAEGIATDLIIESLLNRVREEAQVKVAV